MYLRVETNWPCWQRTKPCDGKMIVIGEDHFHSVSCVTCGYGTSKPVPLPEEYVDRLIQEGYIRQISKRPVERSDLHGYFSHAIRTRRTPQEMADDLLERYEVFVR